MKKYRACLLAPAAVCFLLLLLYSLFGLYPLGGKTLSWCDMSQQVVPFLLEFKDILTGHAGLFLNMENAGGMNFWGVFLFFIASPFTFLTAFVPKQDMMLFANILVLLKMTVCALTASLFFRTQFKKLTDAQAVLLSVLYAFCGYALLFYQNVVWLDMMALFPLLLLSLHCLVIREKPLFFIIALSCVIAVNFYLSYMVLLFLLLGFGVLIFLSRPRERRGQHFLLLGLSVLISLLITGPVWLPAFLQYTSSGRGVNLLQNLAQGDFFTPLTTTLPLLFCTAAVFAALPMFSSERLKERRESRVLLILFAGMLLPVVVEPINKMWHTGSYQGFPVRYGYIPVFLGLILLAVFLARYNTSSALKSSRKAVAAGFAAIAVTAAAGAWLLSGRFSELTAYTRTLWGDGKSFVNLLLFFVVCGFSYFLLFLFYKHRRLTTRMLTLFMSILVLGECLFNGSVYIGSAAQPDTEYRTVMDLSNRIQDSSFYRVKSEKTYFYPNYIGAMGYSTLNHYTSLTPQDTMFTLKKLGYSSCWMAVSSNGGTLLTDALLSNKYTIYKSYEAPDDSKVVYSNEEYALCQNAGTLPLGLITGNSSLPQTLPDGTRAQNQAFLFKQLFPSSGSLVKEYNYDTAEAVSVEHTDVYSLKKQSGTPGVLQYNVKVSGTQTLYFDCFMYLTHDLTEPIYKSFMVTVNGRTMQASYPNSDENGILNLGTFTNEPVTIQVGVLKDVTAKSFGVFGIDNGVLQNAVQSARTADLKVTGGTISGTAQAGEEGKNLFLSLPYDKGYTASVNGKTVPLQRVLDNFMALPLEKGQNTITLTYVPPGFVPGLILSTLGLVALFLLLFALKRGFYAKLKFLEKPAAAVYTLLFAAALFMLYIFPVAVYILL